MSILGVCFIKLGVGSRFLRTRVFVTTRIQQIILGLDWLAERKRVMWDFVLAKVHFGTRGEWIPLQRELSRPPVVSMFKSESWSHTRQLQYLGLGQPKLCFGCQHRNDTKQVLTQIQTCNPVYFQRDSTAHKIILIRILEHPKVNTLESELHCGP